jgi:hypothetical protein
LFEEAMNDEVEESLVDDLLRRYLEDERRQLERQARATPPQVVDEVPPAGPQHVETADRPDVLSQALGYQDATHDAEHRALMRAVEHLRDDPLPAGCREGRPPKGRGHRISWESDTCLLCGARRSRKTGWRTDCSASPPRRVRSKETCAVAVAEAANKIGLTNTNGRPIDSDAVLKMYSRWQRHGSPRDRAHDRLLGRTQK